LYVLLLALVTPQYLKSQTAANPAPAGFDEQGSDKRAIEIADKVMQAMGGREAYDKTRYITWRFFGKRFHLWDKWTGNIRVEHEKLTVLMNIHTRKGRAWQDSVEITEPDSLARLVKFGYEAWINDSYWVVMPYKLKDSGVTLKYVGEGKMENETPAHILELTFNDVGVTPNNKYRVYVNKESWLVEEWAFFRSREDEKPRFKTPWANWTQHGNIMLSSDRGKWKHTDLKVLDRVPAEYFASPAPIKF